MTSRSPAVLIGVMPLAVQSGSAGVRPGVHCRLLNSKSMFVVPDGSWTRDQNRLRNPFDVVPSWWMPKNFRSLLFGGMLPLTTLGTAVSSLAPWPKDSSVGPLAESALRISATFAQSMDGAGSSTRRLASVSISKLLPGRLTSGWLANALNGAVAPATSTTAPTRSRCLGANRRACRALAVSLKLMTECAPYW
jgi:hypothetical protein